MQTLIETIKSVNVTETFGRVSAVQGLLVEIAGPLHAMGVGSHLIIRGGDGLEVQVEVVGFREDKAICLPFNHLEGVRMGYPATLLEAEPCIQPCQEWLGRVIDAFGRPIDGGEPLPSGTQAIALRGPPPPPHTRQRVGPPIDLGVRALNTFTTCCLGQRMGIFAGSGVGKSMLMGMLARNMQADIAVIALIGERGREVAEFIEDTLGSQGLNRSILIVATSDESALMRRQAAYMAMAVSEFFRMSGQNVLLMMDSLTRFAQAQREIGLAAGEPPTSKGYTPTVFSELPRLLERAGPGRHGEGSVTGLFTVLVEGDDHNEPVADAVRAIIDGHVVMERQIAERGRYPAVNVLKSISRTMPDCVPHVWRPVLQEARKFMSTYADMEELIRLGAYRRGSEPEVDEAIRLQPSFEAFLSQAKEEQTNLEEGYTALADILTESDEGLS